MSQAPNESEEELHPDVRPGTRFNKVWIIPIVTLLLGVWLVKHNIDNQGEVITIRFENADGIKEGKTEVKCRNVNIGMVEQITLTDDLAVEVEVLVKPQHLHLIRKDSRFWVEKPRVQGASISGLGTLVSGAFLQLDPGIGDEGAREFQGSENPPLTPRTVQGLRLTLTAERPGSIGIGSGIYFKDTLIGRVESRAFNMDTRTVNFGIFVEDQYRDLITENSLFWQASGINLEVGPEGFALDLPSLDALVAGRISVGVPKGLPAGEAMPDEMVLALFKSKEEAQNTTFQGGVEFLLMLDKSLRGLSVGSPVEFRGLQVGRVGKIAYSLVEADEINIKRIPILIQLDSRLMATHFPANFVDEGSGGFEHAFQAGLRASLKSSNLLTGQLFVDLDFGEENFNPIEKHYDLIVLPTENTGLESLQDQIASLLEKFNKLEIETLITKVGETSDKATLVLENVNQAMVSSKGVVADAQTTLKEISGAVKSLNAILVSEDTKSLSTDLRETLAQVNKSLEPLSNDGAVYGDLRHTMDELRAAIRSIDRMTTEIADKPNSLLFGKDANTKKIPRARR
ncbi:MlaD family protein [Akkermansiaceae bacterium]|jgi:paraquat-inducible protein B|nr:MlaD family protein [Akkermansiaceae bacterium]